MDNLTHSLAGAVLGQMGLKRKTGLAMPTLVIAANLPDIDAFAVLLGGHQHLALRRGITHGPIAMLVLPVILWALMLWFDRWQVRHGKRPTNRLPVHPGWLLALAYIGTISHPALDWLNNYGIRLLEPFSSQWFYGDTLFIIDIWVWIALIAGVWISRRREKAGRDDWRKPATAAFVSIFLYIVANGLISSHAENAAKKLVIARYDPTASMPDPLVVANAVPIEFWKREIAWRDAFEMGKGDYQLGRGASLAAEVQAHRMDSLSPEAKAVAGDPDARDFLFWARMPFAESAKDGSIIIRDQRFDNRAVRNNFEVIVRTRE
ncbi:MAG TPA: metal-dependent hydrolase [Sphingorhabdus sp.]|nr:metal-dependent hydrolase [Sphingorhabdus sp.]